jgi:hypothetical protein
MVILVVDFLLTHSQAHGSATRAFTRLVVCLPHKVAKGDVEGSMDASYI